MAAASNSDRADTDSDIMVVLKNLELRQILKMNRCRGTWHRGLTNKLGVEGLLLS